MGVTHIQRGNAKGAITLLRRASDGLSAGGEAPYGIDAAGLAAHAAALSEDLAAEVDIAPQRLKPRLVAGPG